MLSIFYHNKNKQTETNGKSLNSRSSQLRVVKGHVIKQAQCANVHQPLRSEEGMTGWHRESKHICQYMLSAKWMGSLEGLHCSSLESGWGVMEQIQGYSGTFLEKLPSRLSWSRNHCPQRRVWIQRTPSMWRGRALPKTLLAKEGRGSLGGTRGYQWQSKSYCSCPPGNYGKTRTRAFN